MTKEEFKEHIVEFEGCWLWHGSKKFDHYGVITLPNKKRQAAHRFSWELFNGPIQAGLLICHKCDRGPCVNPDHLFLGTHKDNMLDMVAKGRCYSGYRNASNARQENFVGHVDQRGNMDLLMKRWGRVVETVSEMGTQSAAARKPGISRERVRQIVNKFGYYQSSHS